MSCGTSSPCGAWACPGSSGSDRLKGAAESAEGLVAHLERGVVLIVGKGIDPEQLYAASWVMPGCSTASMSPEVGERFRR